MWTKHVGSPYQSCLSSPLRALSHISFTDPWGRSGQRSSPAVAPDYLSGAERHRSSRRHGSCSPAASGARPCRLLLVGVEQPADGARLWGRSGRRSSPMAAQARPSRPSRAEHAYGGSRSPIGGGAEAEHARGGSRSRVGGGAEAEHGRGGFGSPIGGRARLQRLSLAHGVERLT
jgi:hypothetical protein